MSDMTEEGTQVRQVEKVSYGYSPNSGDRSLTLWEQTGTDDDPYGGWSELDSYHHLSDIVVDGESTEKSGNLEQTIEVRIDDDVAYIQTV